MPELSEIDLKVFVDAVTHYFQTSTDEPATIRSAYLAQDIPPSESYIGLITCSGRFRGCVHFSAADRMVRELLRYWGEHDHSEANLLDAVGEIANTIAGNARRHFGTGLQISVPVKLRGPSERIKAAVRARPFVIALRWRDHNAIVVVDLAPDE
ncbi:chemotaxis protein CheX [Methylomagnum ishizawai]|uniref:Chemotaxis protein CheX n=1 Tax=Methylomagnum ishizawai TaxID=1760988 RepID=A0A1Y6CXR5_9GAMM|nr:chemotaxis protein CheX [Methylomagnum ishizawai]SMF95468.1 chemotaxis protein CheX [Methylomagnum ishizawai]